jgi:thymidylate synthase (FAD)
MREYYTHIGGAPTRLQASTRYITYDDFAYITPDFYSDEIIEFYQDTMDYIADRYETLVKEYGMAKEDAANVLPLGMESKVVVRTNPRQLIDMDGTRECARAYWEFRNIMKDIKAALSDYSEEWKYIIDTQFKVKCDIVGYCLETECCGRNEKKN